MANRTQRPRWRHLDGLPHRRRFDSILLILKPNPYYRGPQRHNLTAIGFTAGLPADTALGSSSTGTSRTWSSCSIRPYARAAHWRAATATQHPAAARATTRRPWSKRTSSRSTRDTAPSPIAASGKPPPTRLTGRRATPYPLHSDLQRARAPEVGPRRVATMACQRAAANASARCSCVASRAHAPGIDIAGAARRKPRCKATDPAVRPLRREHRARLPRPGQLPATDARARRAPRLAASTRTGVSHLTQLRGDTRHAAAVKLADPPRDRRRPSRRQRALRDRPALPHLASAAASSPARDSASTSPRSAGTDRAHHDFRPNMDVVFTGQSRPTLAFSGDATTEAAVRLVPTWDEHQVCPPGLLRRLLRQRQAGVRVTTIRAPGGRPWRASQGHLRDAFRVRSSSAAARWRCRRSRCSVRWLWCLRLGRSTS